MTTKVNKAGDTWTETEYQVREIDECGDAQDVNGFDTKKEALEFAYGASDWDAVVVEKVVKKYPFGRGEDKYTTIYTAGSKDALAAGGWDKE